jgi:two-component sensor histidine kinase
MAVHELATNACAHGALSVPGGRLSVTWRLEGPATDPGQRLVLHWVESGGPAVAGPPERRGFGFRVVDGVVRGQLGGTLSLDWRRSGLVCDLSLPLARPPRQSGLSAA